MKSVRTDITAGEAAESATKQVVSGLLTAWLATSIPYLLCDNWRSYQFPDWTVFNPLVSIGRQALSAAQFWGLPLAGLNLVVTWRLVFHSADRFRSAALIAASTLLIALGEAFKHTAYWREVSTGIWSVVAVGGLITFLAWRRLRT